MRRLAWVIAVGALAGVAVFLWPRRPAVPPGPIPRIDVHTHVPPYGLPMLHALMDRYGIAHVVNLSGMWPGYGLDIQLELLAHLRRESFTVFRTAAVGLHAPQRQHPAQAVELGPRFLPGTYDP